MLSALQPQVRVHNTHKKITASILTDRGGFYLVMYLIMLREYLHLQGFPLNRCFLNLHFRCLHRPDPHLQEDLKALPKVLTKALLKALLKVHLLRYLRLKARLLRARFREDVLT